MIVKLSYIGGMQESNGKSFREIGAEEWGQERKRAYKCAKDFDALKVGDSADIMLSDNGKYVNAVKTQGGASRPTGGKGFTSRSSPASDPEKNISVYTSYVLEYLIAPHQKTALSVPEAVKLVFDIRKAVGEAFAGKAEAAPTNGASPSVEESIKIDTAFAVAQQVDPNADSRVWKTYIGNTLRRKGAYDVLMKNLNACMDGSKDLEYTPDGIPAFTEPGA